MVLLLVEVAEMVLLEEQIQQVTVVQEVVPMVP
jgi:hypothetical protein